MQLDKYSNLDPYTNKDGVLKNKLNITDENILEKKERNITWFRSIELTQKPINGKFDLNHLQKIHYHLFQDIYSWAGKIRTVDISKGKSRFCSHRFIQSYCKKIANNLKKQNFLSNLSPQEFCHQAAYFLGEYNAVHPFREGNGRTIRYMIEQLANQNNYTIHWENMTKEEMIHASEVSTIQGDNSLLEQMLLTNIEIKNNCY
ncbi:MAG: Fic family protein [Neisseriaceae bacterium]|nr:Fic family protein [Neisseriaceae bacterium]